MASLDDLELESELRHRALVLQSVPGFLRGAFRAVFRQALRAIQSGKGGLDAVRGWKLLMLAPRMLLYREPGETKIPELELKRRFERFNAGAWMELLGAARFASG